MKLTSPPAIKNKNVFNEKVFSEKSKAKNAIAFFKGSVYLFRAAHSLYKLTYYLHCGMNDGISASCENVSSATLKSCR